MSASFHMAQRTGVLLSGDYAAPVLSGISDWPEGSYGISKDGTVLRKYVGGYEVFEHPEYRRQFSPDVSGYAIVGWRWKLADAKAKAAERAKGYADEQTKANEGYKAEAEKAKSAPPVSSSYVPASTPDVPPQPTPFYKKNWFLPAVGAGTLGVVLLIALWPAKKKEIPVVYAPAPQA